MGAVISRENSGHSQQRTESVQENCVPECCCIIYLDLRSISGLSAGDVLEGSSRIIRSFQEIYVRNLGQRTWIKQIKRTRAIISLCFESRKLSNVCMTLVNKSSFTYIVFFRKL